MTGKGGLYDQHYSALSDPVYKEIRAETFDEDLGQTGWLTGKELRGFIASLELTASCRVLEVACGAGGACMVMAHESGARVVGVDVNEHAVQAAAIRAAREIHNDRVVFRHVDASGPLPFADHSFDVVFCNDAINHLGDRRARLADWHRLLRPGGQVLYTDPVVVTGAVTAAEIEARSTVGSFVFFPRGENQLLLQEAGFTDIHAQDASDNIIEISSRWRDARFMHRQALEEMESPKGYEANQAFLTTVHLLAEEGRLSRYAFRGRCRKP